MVRVHSPIIGAGREQYGRISGSILHILIGRIGVERVELLEIAYTSELGHVEDAIWVELETEHVVHSDVGNDSAKQIRSLRQRRSHQQSAIASAQNSQPRTGGVLRANQVFGARDEIIKDVLFACEISFVVPFLAVSPSTADVSDYKDPAVIEPYAPQRTHKVRVHADAKPAVSFQKHRIPAVELRAFLPNNIQWNASAIFGSCELAHRLGVVEVNGGSTCHRSSSRFAGLAVHPVPGSGLQPGRGRQ